MTVHASTFSFDLVVRVWDSFLTEGWKVVYRVMLAMLKQNQEVLLSKGIEGIIPYLLREFPSTVNADSIMSLSQRIPLKTRHIQKYAEDFRKMIENNEIEAQEILHGVSGERSLDGDASVASSSIVSKRLPVLRFVKKLTSARREVQIEDLSEKLGRFAVLIHNVLSPEECRELVRRAKGENFQEILVRGAGKYHADVASCDRCVVKDADLAAELFNRVTYALQGSGLDKNLQHASGNATMCATGLSNQLHFLKFRQGDFFAPHRDSQYKRGHETSYVTLQVYLNSSYRGGITSFNGSGGKHFDLKAKTGTILLFSQDLRRQETAVTEGRRFTIRADIMYGQSPLN
jgi:predicted 2-oxoglutarate/Fe(II)-dependent dioxygenase YbiX